MLHESDTTSLREAITQAVLTIHRKTTLRNLTDRDYEVMRGLMSILESIKIGEIPDKEIPTTPSDSFAPTQEIN